MDKTVRYLKMHLAGQLPFAMTFFLNYVLVANALAFLLGLVLSNVDWDGGFAQKALVIYAFTIFIVAYIWGVIGVGASLLINKNKWFVWICWPVLIISALRVFRFLQQSIS